MAPASTDRRQGQAVPVHAVGGDPRAFLDSVARHAARADYLRREGPRAQGADGRHGGRVRVKPDEAKQGVFEYVMPQPIPSYLIALAVGDLAFQSLGPRTGVWAEPSVLKAAAFEFAEVESMVQSVEKGFGPYRWGAMTSWCFPPAFHLEGWKIPG